MAAHFEISPENFLGCHQIHSSKVVTIQKPWASKDAPQADAMVTSCAGIAIGIFTADCVPVLIAAKNAPAIGAAHAGWRGALAGILENTIDAMEKLGAQRKNCVAGLGPCIAQKSYEVGPEFVKPFLSEKEANERFFKFENNKVFFDLPGYVVAKLQGLGVGLVDPPAADTCAEPGRFFSHRWSTLRGESRKGSLISAIALK